MSTKFKFNPITGNLDLVGDSGTQDALSAERLIVTRIAEEDISALKLVTASEPNEVRISDPNAAFEDAQVLGLALNSATTGNEVQVLLSGAHTDPSFSSLTLNSKLFLGATGSITQTAPTTGHQTDVGEYIGDNAVFIFRRQPIIL